MADDKLIRRLLQPYEIVTRDVVRMDGYGSQNFKIADQNGRKCTLKYYKEPHLTEIIRSETRLVREISPELPYLLQQPVKESQPLHIYEDGSFSRLLHFIEGQFLAESDYNGTLLNNLGIAIGQLSKALTGHSDPAIRSYRHDWDLNRCLSNWSWVRHIDQPSLRKLVNYYFDMYEHHVVPQVAGLRHAIIHNDWNEWNILIKGNKVHGLLDFGDMCYAPIINELAIALVYVMMSCEDPLDRAVRVISGYQSVFPMLKEEIELLPYLIPARLCQSVCHSAKKRAVQKDSEYILISEKPAWALLEKWGTFNPDRLRDEFLQAANQPRADQVAVVEVLKKRNQFLSPALSLSYRNPIQMTGAAFQYMYDRQGNTFLDAYNNIPHVGHCHPSVSRAISAQVRQLNTNTRYLHESITRYSEKLVSLFPEKLDTVLFVNSGSEASDLAVRMARNYTEREHMLILEHGYHGNTQRGIEISHYKFSGKGGQGPTSAVTSLFLPKIYQGKFTSTEEYVTDAIKRIDRLIGDGTLPAALIAEPVSGCGGQVPLATGYWKQLKKFLDSHGILSIADEVQVGFGRMGNHFWGFELHDIIPDIVVLGKPMANGHPIGAVVTTGEIAHAFDNGMEFFSSFGGNPVSMEAANAVLKVIFEEDLKENAQTVGEYFWKIADEMKSEIDFIGDVRCRGLFLGIEFTDPNTMEPATDVADLIKNGMRDRFVLTGTDGPFDNVLKMKPPLCFTKNNVDRFFDVFVEVVKTIQ